MNELARHNYLGQELFAPWLVKKSKPKPDYIPARIKADWKMPVSPVGEICPKCGDKIEPIAHNTGEGWCLGWQCEGGLCELPALEEGMIGAWPFIEYTANWRDLQNIGFTIV